MELSIVKAFFFFFSPPALQHHYHNTPPPPSIKITQPQGIIEREKRADVYLWISGGAVVVSLLQLSKLFAVEGNHKCVFG